jgi:hypothetical protein
MTIISSSTILSPAANEELIRLVQQLRQSHTTGTIELSGQSGTVAGVLVLYPEFREVDMSEDTPKVRAIEKQLAQRENAPSLGIIEIDLDD